MRACIHTIMSDILGKKLESALCLYVSTELVFAHKLLLDVLNTSYTSSLSPFLKN